MNKEEQEKKWKESMELFYFLQEKAAAEQKEKQEKKTASEQEKVQQPKQPPKQVQIREQKPESKRKQERKGCPMPRARHGAAYRMVDSFLREAPSVAFRLDGQITSQKLYELYTQWCREKGMLYHTPCAFGRYLTKHAQEYNILPVNGIRSETGSRVRGFRGICAQEENNGCNAFAENRA